MQQSKTAGQIQNELNRKDDNGFYTAYDLGYGTTDSIWPEVIKCAETHAKTFAKPKYCVVMQYATDPLLRNIVRRKFYAVPWLPDPRPSQSVWLYDHGKMTFLWCLPDPYTMVKLVESAVVDHEYARMKTWCHWWYEPNFWANIRKQHKIEMLSEMEINESNREKGGKFIKDSELGFTPDTFYLPQVRIKKLETVGYPSGQKLLDDTLRKAN